MLDTIQSVYARTIAHVDGRDPFYVGLKPNKQLLYQRHFDCIMENVDSYINTKATRVRLSAYERDLHERDTRFVRAACTSVENYGVEGRYLATMAMQYFHADPSIRDSCKHVWVDTVCHSFKARENRRFNGKASTFFPLGKDAFDLFRAQELQYSAPKCEAIAADLDLPSLAGPV